MKLTTKYNLKEHGFVLVDNFYSNEEIESFKFLISGLFSNTFKREICSVNVFCAEASSSKLGFKLLWLFKIN